MPDATQRLLLVHAHPDDETIGNGATMAKYVAEGRQVTCVTCTAGEMGEILVPDLAHLAGAVGEEGQEDLCGAPDGHVVLHHQLGVLGVLDVL